MCCPFCLTDKHKQTVLAITPFLTYIPFFTACRTRFCENRSELGGKTDILTLNTVYTSVDVEGVEGGQVGTKMEITFIVDINQSSGSILVAGAESRMRWYSCRNLVVI